MSYKAVLAYCNVLTDEGVGLNSGPVAYNTSFLYLDKGSDKNIIAQLTFINVYRHDYFHIFTLFYVTNTAFNNLHINCVPTRDNSAQSRS
ncbi:hypothetical protein NB714_003466 [Pantoea dispersa]|nr:hypothetical protein [Pantoea dispersa]MCW0327341.1 hypothetical protein [Pantoea dispersa]MCW0433766.1 hypothetical protein [Pantoea dispersa]